jgi:hypothetical protein
VLDNGLVQLVDGIPEEFFSIENSFAEKFSEATANSYQSTDNCEKFVEECKKNVETC